MQVAARTPEGPVHSQDPGPWSPWLRLEEEDRVAFAHLDQWALPKGHLQRPARGPGSLLPEMLKDSCVGHNWARVLLMASAQGSPLLTATGPLPHLQFSVCRPLFYG